MIPHILDGNTSLFGLGWMADRGASTFGRLIDQRADETNGVYLVSWTKELFSGIEETDVAVLVFHDGEFIDSVVGRDYCFFVPRLDSPLDRITLHLVPNHELWREQIDTPGLDCRVRLRWHINGYAYTEKVLGNAGASIDGTVLDEFDGPTVQAEFPLYVDQGLTAFGTWLGPWIAYETILVQIVTGGMVDEATYSWNYEGQTGTGICRSYAEHLINGAMVQFEEDRFYPPGQAWYIRIGLPGEYTTQKFSPGGTYCFRVDSYNQSGTVSAGDSVETVTINTPPGAPVIQGTPSYVAGSGQIALTWKSPNESDVTHYRIYKNRPALGERDIHWEWITMGTVSPNTNFSYTVTGLEAGYNRVVAVAIDSSGAEGKETLYEIELDGSLNAIATPNKPEAIYATIDTVSGDIAVTVWADDSSDTINLYWDNGTGTIDYNTPVATIANPQADVFQELSGTIPIISAGGYLVAARAEYNGTEETNTDVVSYVVIDPLAAGPTLLEAVVVA